MALEKYTISLLENLAPFTRLIRLTGGLLPWDTPLPSNKIQSFLRFTVAALVGLGMCCVFAVGSYSIFEKMTNPTYPISDLVATWLQYLSFPISITTFASFAWNRKSIYKFIQTWKRLEEPLAMRRDLGIKPTKYYRLFSICVVITVIIMSVFLTISGVGMKMANDSVSVVGLVLNTHTTNLVHILTCCVSFYTILLNCFGEAFFSYVYSHLAFLLHKIEKAFLIDVEMLRQPQEDLLRVTDLPQTLFCISGRRGSLISRVTNFDEDLTTKSAIQIINQMFNRYKHLQILAESANKLLGCMLFAYYSLAFLSISSGLFVLLSFLRSQNMVQTEAYKEKDFLMTSVIAMAIFSGKLIITTILCSNLPKQCKKFENTVSCLLQDQWEEFLFEEKQLLQAFLHHVRNSPLVANSLGLFSIQMSTLLSMLSLVVTYVIVLVQTQGV